jgi:two-component system response regulator GlrR
MSNRPLVLLVDDDTDLLQLLSIRLKRAGYDVITAPGGRQALVILERRQPRAVVTDLKMDDLDGMALLAEIESRYPTLPVILMTAHGTIPDAVEATRNGALAFLTKPLNDAELIEGVRKAVEQHPAGEETQHEGAWRAEILTRSPVMESLLQEAKLVAASDASIIIQSQSGTGKEMLARAIHAVSARSASEFVAVNCTAIPEALFESELFGHVKGAFTGAHRDRGGLFQEANGGTLFLDEVGEMPLDFQAKLLRVLQEKCVRPVGADSAIDVNVRVIAATHRDLEQIVSLGEFREDLFYRLGVVTLELPPLSERREDIPLLANHFLRAFADDGRATNFSAEAMERLMVAPWPGNVRQLANVVQHCKVLSRGETIPAGLVERSLKGKVHSLVRFADARDQFELNYLSNVLQMTEGNVTQAARLAGRNRSEFYKLLSKHELDPELFRPALGSD